MQLRHSVMVLALVGLATLGGLAALTNSAEATATQEAVATIRTPLQVGGRFLMGRYLVVHDEERKARGEPCTSIYDLGRQGSREPVVAFHCKRVRRDVAEAFTIESRATDLGWRVLTAYQFPGSDHAHQVLTPREVARSHSTH